MNYSYGRKNRKSKKLILTASKITDVLTYAFLIAEKFNLDIFQIVEDKIKVNNLKYPLEKSKGTAKKYTDL